METGTDTQWYKIVWRPTPSSEWENDPYESPFSEDMKSFRGKLVEGYNESTVYFGTQYEKYRIVPATPEEVEKWNNG